MHSYCVLQNDESISKTDVGRRNRNGNGGEGEGAGGKREGRRAACSYYDSSTRTTFFSYRIQLNSTLPYSPLASAPTVRGKTTFRHSHSHSQLPSLALWAPSSEAVACKIYEYPIFGNLLNENCFWVLRLLVRRSQNKERTAAQQY